MTTIIAAAWLALAGWVWALAAAAGRADRAFEDDTTRVGGGAR